MSCPRATRHLPSCATSPATILKPHTAPPDYLPAHTSLPPTALHPTHPHPLAFTPPAPRHPPPRRTFTDTALSLALTLLNSLIDLVSFSGILFSIYPPLFGALLAYSLGGTAISVALGKPLVGLNFNQEAREADMRWVVWCCWCAIIVLLVCWSDAVRVVLCLVVDVREADMRWGQGAGEVAVDAAAVWGQAGREAGMRWVV